MRLVIVLGILLTACTDATSSASESAVSPSASVPTASESASQAPSGSATPQPTVPPAGPIEVTWAAPQVFPDQINALVADGDRFVAIGVANEAQAAWTSTDGVSWTSQAVPIASLDDLDADFTDIGPDFASKSAQMGRLVRLGDTLYSFGFFNFMDFIRPVGWYWTDGGAWQPVTSNSPFYEAGNVRDVIGAGGALVTARTEPAISLIGADSTVWTWRSNTSWVQSDLSVGDSEPVLVTDLAWSDGTYLATGFVTPPDELTPAVLAAWTSTDGDAWTGIDAPAGGQEICALEPRPGGGFIALGVEEGQTLGWTWNEVAGWVGGPIPGAPGHAQQGIDPFYGLCELVPVAGRILAVAQLPGATRTWTTVDGSSWMDSDDPPAGDPTQIAALGDTIVFLTVAYTDDGTRTDTLHVGTVAP